MTYEYLCTACGHAWEAEQPISADPLKSCPNCHKDTAKRQVSGGAGFILKGGGWYADLYGSAPAKGADAKPDAAKDASKGEAGGTKLDKDSASVAAKASDSGSSSASSSSGSSGSGGSGSSSGSKGSGTSSAA